MIVDDEKYIRKSLKNRIDWPSYGLTVEAEAGNGEEALALMPTARPQIVVVDIRMPKMDGLAFVAAAKKKFPNTTYIIMSAYSDFEYARKALQIGVEDYILKPVEEAEIGKVLHKIVHRLDEARLTRELEASGAVQGEWLNLDKKQALAITFYIYDQEDQSALLHTQLEQVCAARSMVISLYALKEFSRNSTYVFLICGGELSAQLGPMLIREMWSAMPDREGSAACSEVMPAVQAGKAARQSVEILKRKVFFPERKLIEKGAVQEDLPEKKKELRAQVMRVYQQLAKQNYMWSKKTLNELVDTTLQETNSVELVELLVSEILTVLKYQLGRESSADFEVRFHHMMSHDYLLSFPTISCLKEQLKQAITQAIEAAMPDENGDVILSVKNYILEHYASELNAADIAQKHFLNPSYLSTLFKEHTGMNFSAYLEGVRMEKAKCFLANGDQSITKIAMDVGYSDAGYFTKVFKKYSGMTPRQFRETGE